VDIGNVFAGFIKTVFFVFSSSARSIVALKVFEFVLLVLLPKLPKLPMMLDMDNDLFGKPVLDSFMTTDFFVFFVFFFARSVVLVTFW
jgi:hypothetical protein